MFEVRTKKGGAGFRCLGEKEAFLVERSWSLFTSLHKHIQRSENPLELVAQVVRSADSLRWLSSSC